MLVFPEKSPFSRSTVAVVHGLRTFLLYSAAELGVMGALATYAPLIRGLKLRHTVGTREQRQASSQRTPRLLGD